MFPTPSRAVVRPFRLIAGVAVVLMGLTGATCSRSTKNVAPGAAPEAGAMDVARSPSEASTRPRPRVALWANGDGVCRLVDDTLECCGRGVLDGLRVPRVNGVWMGYSNVCYTNIAGGGACSNSIYRYEVPADTTALTAVSADRGMCILTAGGSVECLSDGQWRVVMDRAEALEASLSYVFVLSSGDIWCWGQGGLECSPAGLPNQLTSVGDIVAIETSLMGHVCGLRVGGVVLCWGGPGNIGYGARSRPMHYVTMPTYVRDIAPMTWFRRVGFAAFCGGGEALSDTIQCWGFGPAPLCANVT